MSISVENLKANLTNPARVYMWDVVIPSPVGGGDSNTLMLRCQSTNMPGRSVGNIAVPYKQSAGIQFMGKLTYSHTWECTFIEGEDANVFSAFYDWAQSQINDRDNIGIGDNLIKTDIILRLVTTKGSEYLSIKLIGCYVDSMADVPLAYDTEDPVRLTVTFRYDRWEKVT